MKKLSEILKLAMPSYIERLASLESIESKNPSGNMCVRISRLRNILISGKEEDFARREIEKKIEGFMTLVECLRSKGRKTTAAAQIQFYQKWIKQLEREGL